MDNLPPLTEALASLQGNPNFEVLLRELKRKFAERVRILAECSPEEAEKHRGVLLFIEEQFRFYAGKSILGEDSLS